MLKRLSACIGEYKKDTILSPTFIAMEVVMECLLPLMMSKLIDHLYGEDVLQIVKFGCILLAMAFLSLTFGVLSGMFSSKAAAGFAKNLRRDLFYRVQTFSFGDIDKFSTSSLVTRLTTDVTNVQNAFMMLIRIAVRAPFMFLFALAMSFSISWKLSLIFLAFIPLMLVVVFFLIRKVKPMFDRIFKKYDALNDSVQENVKGMRVVKSYNREQFETEKFDRRSEELRSDFTRVEKIMALTNPLMMFVMHTSTLLIAFLGATLIVRTFGGIDAAGVWHWGELSTGQLSSLFTYSAQILMSLMMVSMVFVMITMAGASAKRIAEVLDTDSSLTNPAHPVEEVANGDVEFCNVNFKYSKKAERNALQGIDFKIKSGETVGIIGGTGSGKSTLIQLIPRLYDATEGVVKVGGRDVREYDMEALRNQVAVVLQKNVLFSGTIKENLRWGNETASDEELVRVCKLAQADEFIRSFPDGYDTVIDQGGANVSGGQKQRLCIARALLKKPKIMILDDSTSAVDTKTDALIRKAFREEIPDTTKFIIAQRVASVEGADKIIVMDGGRIDAVGTHEELMQSNRIYQEVYHSQTRIGGAQ